MRAMIVGLLGLGATLAGCGPSAFEQRACEMYADEGGSEKREREAWASLQKAKRDGDQREERLTNVMWMRESEENMAALNRVSRRLSMSNREVVELLKRTCPDWAHLRTVQPASQEAR